MRNRTRILCRKSKKQFIFKKINETKSDSKKLWETLNSIISSKTKNKSNYIPLSAESLNNTFIDERDSMINQEFEEQYDCYYDFHLKTDKLFSIPLISEENIRKIVSKQSVLKATGSDGISAKFVKLFLDPLIPHLLALFNSSIKCGVYPTPWKIARVSALYKSGARTIGTNYRPISVLPFISKIIEKHVFITFNDFLKENSLLSQTQFGFQRNHSTTDALLTVHHNIIDSLNKRKKCLVLCLDLKKAFDLVSHQLLLDKLFTYGCDSQAMRWFTSYITNRYQFVRTQTSLSNIRHSGTVSVAQGSIGGPLLFNLFINDLAQLPINGKLTLFADDTTITLNANTFQELELNTNHDLNLIDICLRKNRLILNSEKSSFMVMGCPRTDINMSINIGTRSIKRVNQMKILGINFNPSLNFEIHLSNVCKTINNRLNFMRRISEYMPKNILKLIYNSIVLPHFDYGDVIWCHTYDNHLKRLYSLQRRASHIILNKNFIDSWNENFRTLKWMRTEERIKFHSIIYIFKSINKMTSDITSNFFIYSTNRRSGRISDDRKLILLKANNNFYQNSLFSKGIAIFNDLNYEFRSLTEFNFFRRLVIKLFMTNI